MSTTVCTTEELRQLGMAVFTAAGVAAENAAQVVDALVEAELDGIGSHGFSRIPFYADQAVSGKVNGTAVPVISSPKPAVVLADACNGFSFPAINAGLEKAMERAAEMGVCAFGVTRSHHCGVLGHFVEKIALRGFLGVAFANTPAAMAPWGGTRACFGTNPLAFSCPRVGDAPLVVDLSLSKVARGKIMTAKQKGEPIPEGWALDAEGKATTSPEAALAGTMVPLGDAKGAALALMVEILAATLTGANHAYEASSFFEASGDAPGVGQFFIIIDPQSFHAGFAARLENLFHAILDQGNTRLPGDRRKDLRAKHMRDGIAVQDALLADLRRRAAL